MNLIIFLIFVDQVLLAIYYGMKPWMNCRHSSVTIKILRNDMNITSSSDTNPPLKLEALLNLVLRWMSYDGLLPKMWTNSSASEGSQDKRVFKVPLSDVPQLAKIDCWKQWKVPSSDDQPTFHRNCCQLDSHIDQRLKIQNLTVLFSRIRKLGQKRCMRRLLLISGKWSKEGHLHLLSTSP